MTRLRKNSETDQGKGLGIGGGKGRNKGGSYSIGGYCICAKCGASMILRKAKKGNNTGNEFWGCSTFPKCRNIVNSKC